MISDVDSVSNEDDEDVWDDSVGDTVTDEAWVELSWSCVECSVLVDSSVVRWVSEECLVVDDTWVEVGWVSDEDCGEKDDEDVVK